MRNTEEKTVDSSKEDTEKRQNPEEKKTKEPPPKPENFGYRLREGDYVVQVHLIEARDIVGKGSDGNFSAPVCEVEVMGKKKNTKISRQCKDVVWDTVLVFEFSKVPLAKLKQESITISLFDGNSKLRNVLIGKYRFDITKVYFKKNHELFRQWIALSNPLSKSKGVQAYLKASVVVLGPNDNQKVHSPEEEDDEEDGMVSVIMPPTIEQSAELLTLSIYMFEDLPEMDIGLKASKVQPFIKVKFNGIEVKTKQLDGETVKVLKQILIPVMQPAMSSVIVCALYDWDLIVDERISTFTLDYTDIKNNPELWKKTRWINQYGAPEHDSKGVADKMNRGYVESTWYRGRVLLSASIEQCEEPILDIASCNWQNAPQVHNYIIEMDIYEGSEIPSIGLTSQKMHLELHIGKHVMKTHSVKVENGRCKWYKALDSFEDTRTNIVQFPEDRSINIDDVKNADAFRRRYAEVPDVFIYLCCSDIGLTGAKTRRVSYIRYPMWKLIKDMKAAQWCIPPQWVVLRECQAEKALADDDFPGTILVSLRVGLEDDEKRPKKIPPACRPLTQRTVDSETKISNSPSVYGRLQVRIVEAINLPAADITGASDPFCKIKVGEKHQHQKTATIKKNLNPKWNESFNFKPIHENDSIEIEIYDADRISTELLGTTTISLQKQRIKTGNQGGNFSIAERQFPIVVRKKNHTSSLKLSADFVYLSAEDSQMVMASKKKHKKKSSFTKGILDVISDPFGSGNVPGDPELGQPTFQDFELRGHIYKARNLPPKDSNGLCDPFLAIRLCGRKLKIPKKSKTLNPKWFKSFARKVRLPVHNKSLSMAPSIQLCLFDWDAFDKNDFIGCATITCEEAQFMNKSLTELSPEWIDLKTFDGQPTTGKILVSFQILTEEDLIIAGPLPDIRPKTVPRVLEIVTLGMRNLESPLGIHKSHIDFVLPNGKTFGTESSVIPSARNPNFLQILKMPIQFPVKRIFEPILNFTVRDIMLGGLVTRRIGQADLNLMELMEEDPETKLPTIPKESLWQEHQKAEEKKYLELNHQQEQKDFESKAASYSRYHREQKSYESKSERKKKKKTKKPGLKKPLLDSEDEDSEDDSFYTAKHTVVNDGEGQMLSSMDEHGLDEHGFEEKSPARLGLGEEEEEEEDEDLPPYMKVNGKKREELKDRLEENQDYFPFGLGPFRKINMFTGMREKHRSVGTFKGLVRIVQSENAPSVVDPATLLDPKDVYVRLYVLRGIRLSPKDRNNKSDPYLIVSLGDQVQSTRKNYHKNTLDPEFYERFEFSGKIPGTSSLKIKVMDWDGVGDDFIGEIKIDVEDRWLTPSWRRMEPKPIECMTLKNPKSNSSQGTLTLWVDILDTSTAKKSPMWDIKPPPPMPFELRVIIWRVKNCASKDELTNQNDLYCTCHCDVPGLDRQKTDTHYRAKSGKGNFNWRMKFPLNLPSKRWPRLRFQIWDRDLISSNDAIGEQTIPLKGLCKKAMKKKDIVSITGQERGKAESKKIWLKEITHPNPEFHKDKAHMQISIELLPTTIAAQQPAGFGRSDPNCNPHLPAPAGRLNLSLFHPLDMMRDILGDKLYYKLCGGFCCVLILAACIFTAPMIFSNFISSLFF